jgi:hypothetical protein
LYYLQLQDASNPNQSLVLLRQDHTGIATSAPFGGYWGGGWFLVEWHLKINAGVNSIFELWINGTLLMSVPNLEAPMSADTQFDTIRMGASVAGVFSRSNSAPIIIDDMAINSTAGTVNNGRCFDGYIIPYFPNDVGSNSGLTNNYGTKVDNFKQVSGYPGNTSVGTMPPLVTSGPTQNVTDTYEAPSFPVEVAGISALQLSAFVQRNGPGVGHLQFILIPNNGVPESPIPFPTAPTIQNPGANGSGIPIPNGQALYLSQIIETNPNTSNPFTPAEMSEGEMGLSLLS